MKLFHSTCLSVVLLFCFCTCKQNNSVSVPNETASDTVANAIGVCMNSSSIRPPQVVVAGTPRFTLMGQPQIQPIKPNYGVAGGITYMKNYTTDDGLGLDAISIGHKSALCDTKGNLWFCTAGGGVSRYDGKSFTTYTETQGLASNVVYCVTEDRHGNLWFGTTGAGVSRYDGTSFTNFSTEQGLADNNVVACMEDKSGNLWFGTTSGLSRYDGMSFTNFTIKQGLAGDLVNAIIEDKKGNLWIGTKGSGISCYNGKTFINYSTRHGLVSNDVFCITKDRNGNLWFGTKDGGISYYNGRSFTSFSTKQGLVNNDIRCITEDKKGNLWFGTNGGGISCYNGKSFTNFSTEQGLASNEIHSITEDKNGSLWFGTKNGGVVCYHGAAFINYTKAQGLVNNIVFSIFEDKTGSLWLGCENGCISCYNGKTFNNYTPKQGIPNGPIMCLTGDKNKNIWFGTYYSGLCRYDGKYLAHFTKEQGLPDDNITSIFEDKKGKLWIGTYYNGVSCYDGKSFTNFNKTQGLVENLVLCMAEDKHGNMWFGTTSGVSCFDGHFFTNYTTEQGLANNIVITITEDKHGNMWFGTEGGGMSRYDGTSFVNYTTTQGLPDNVVTQIIVNEDESLIIGTNHGIAILTQFHPKPTSSTAFKTVNAVNRVRNKTLSLYDPTIEIYHSSTGYPVKDVNVGSKTMYLDSKGIIWAGTGYDKTALVRFDYKALNRNTTKPNVFIQSIKISGTTICWHDLQNATAPINPSKSNANILPAHITEEATSFGRVLNDEERNTMKTTFEGTQFDSITKFYPVPQNLILPYKHRHITFQFASIEPTRPYLVKYQYILEGYDKDWSSLTNKTDVSYGNMREGTYTFKLRARSPYGIWTNPISYHFIVLPPWYRTWWMYVCYAAAIAIITFSMIKLSIRRKERKLQRRESRLKQRIDEATFKIKEQKFLIEGKHKEIKDSINYAERIQRALLASEKLLDENLTDYFILFKPKDIVSGDFYWATKLSNSNFVLVVADSTGHGVPGAIMSILNIACIDKAITESITSPDLILNETRRLIIEKLKNDGSIDGGRDGMDGSLLSFDFKTNILYCASANSPIWIIRDGQLIEIKPDRFPIGKHDKDSMPFTLQTFNLQKGDAVYALTDGFIDQFGGSYGKKFKYKQLQELLLSISHEPMNIQKKTLNASFKHWKGEFEQIDDVCIVGIRI